VLANLAFVAFLAAVKFIAPLDGSQVIGPQLIEVTTDAKNVDRVEFSIDGVLAGVARKAPWRIAHDFGSSLASHEIVAKVYSDGFRTTETARVTTAALTAGEAMTVDLVEVPLRARASRTLRASDLRVIENGREQMIRDVRAERGAAHFVFVVDRSLSMGDGKLAAALRAIDSEIHSLRPDDIASIVLFNHNVARPRKIARGDRVASIFGDVAPSGGTSLHDALASIASRERTYAIVITDGGDRNSELTRDEALRRISNTRTVISAIILGDRSDFLANGAKNTGGQIVKATRSTIASSLRDLLADINSRYLVVYQSSNANHGWRSIDVTARTRDVAILNARKGYFAE
jgi:Mg-chelatase subunit ChlD